MGSYTVRIVHCSIVVILLIVGVLGCCTAMYLAHVFSCRMSCRPDIGAVPHYHRGGDHRPGRAQWRGIGRTVQQCMLRGADQAMPVMSVVSEIRFGRPNDLAFDDAEVCNSPSLRGT